MYLIVKNYHQESPGSAVLTEEYASRFGITPREKEIIFLLLSGKSNKEIGEKLFVSHRTVETHVYNIYRKCSVKNKLELARQISAKA
ncbi:MAG: helix-turn-helix transcriptional regulator [Spirochaetia bacterium]|nr:helix-turn-helix transcriptional regulator [Spirochaetia bacterium]